MSKFGFVSAHIYSNLLMGFLYVTVLNQKRVFLFVSAEQSLRILSILILVCNVVGMCLMMKRHRTWFVVLLHTLLPYGIGTLLSYMQNEKCIIIGGLAVAVLTVLGYAFLIFRQKIKSTSKTGRARIVQRRIGKVLVGAYCCMGATLALFALLSFMRVFNTSFEVSASIPATQKLTYTEDELQGVVEEFRKLEQSCWETLTVQEKLNVLQAVANLEQAYLGIPQTLEVVATDMSNRTCGYYEDYTWKIHVNRSHLEEKSAKSVLDTVCHEARHAYQRRAVEVYCRVDEKTRNLQMFRELEMYFEEMFFYVNGTKNYAGYYNQKIEKDARSYAEKRVETYYKILEDRYNE